MAGWADGPEPNFNHSPDALQASADGSSEIQCGNAGSTVDGLRGWLHDLGRT
jgi:hypothetical protein